MKIPAIGQPANRLFRNATLFVSPETNPNPNTLYPIKLPVKGGVGVSPEMRMYMVGRTLARLNHPAIACIGSCSLVARVYLPVASKLPLETIPMKAWKPDSGLDRQAYLLQLKLDTLPHINQRYYIARIEGKERSNFEDLGEIDNPLLPAFLDGVASISQDPETFLQTLERYIDIQPLNVIDSHLTMPTFPALPQTER